MWHCKCHGECCSTVCADARSGEKLQDKMNPEARTDKGAKKEVGSYRPSCTLPALYKLHSTPLYNSFPELDHIQLEEQRGLRWSYQTLDHFATLIIIEEKLQDWSVKMWLATIDFLKAPVAILAQAISCSNVRGAFPVHERFWFCLVQLSTTQFYCFQAFLMARVSNGTNMPIPPSQASSPNYGSPDGSGSDLDGMGTCSGSTTDEKLNALLSNFVHFETQIAQFPALPNWMSRVDSHNTKTLRDFATRLTEMEQNLSTLIANLHKVETYAPSASNVSGSARSWPSLEQVGGSTAAGPMAQGCLMTVETQDADLIRSQAPKMNMREVPVFYGSVANNTTLELRNGSILYGKSPTCQPTNKPGTIHCKAGCRSYSHSKQQEPNVRTLLPDVKMRVSPMQLTVPSVAPKQKSLSANPKHLKTGRSESNLRLCGECWPNSSKILFPGGDDESAFIVPACDARSQILSIKDRKDGIGEPVFKLAPCGYLS